MKVVPLRLQPGDDLHQALETWMGEQQEQAGCVISAIGSLTVAVELPQFGGQVSGLHGGECTGSDELLFVFDWAEVANR